MEFIAMLSYAKIWYYNFAVNTFILFQKFVGISNHGCLVFVYPFVYAWFLALNTSEV